ncbi:hypothetical protein GWI33_014248 [Rhynchophorus ferrugineus]|uniref:Uncharacterized protein n=1 Tax=Rhynchophorus ferrugineus TaxID=354439 RepID=A0A834I5F5_RHYFE|nr:hypothetical protein GWI33_014248 [Rhynchophorus ferrugineus]
MPVTFARNENDLISSTFHDVELREGLILYCTDFYIKHFGLFRCSTGGKDGGGLIRCESLLLMAPLFRVPE